jgi:hypothetical protein
MPVVDSGIVTIYDRKNENKPLVCHRIDAKAFLDHPSKRWSTKSDADNSGLKSAEALKLQQDSGQAMLLKEMKFKQLQTMAKEKGVESWENLDKTALVAAIEAIGKPQEPAKNE